MKVTQIRKRSGEVVVFDQAKIETAIHKAFSATNPQTALSPAPEITAKVIEVLEQSTLDPETIPGVELIQDIVEKEIAESGHFDVAKAYILYRSQRAQERSLERQKMAEQAEKQQLKMIKRDGSKVNFSLYEISDTLRMLNQGLEVDLDLDAILRDVKYSIFDGITADEIVKVVVMVLRSRIERDPVYSKLAARALHMGLYKDVIGIDQGDEKFVQKYRQGFKKAIQNAVKSDHLDKRMAKMDLDVLAAAIAPERDDLFDYLGAQTLYDRYYRRDFDQNILELPQYFWMRVAMGLSLLEAEPEKWAVEFYHSMSQLQYLPSTPTLFHSGTSHSQMSSCYLTTIEDDLTHIFKCVGDNAQLAKWSGGIGNDVTNIRATGSLIHSTNVPSQGVIPFLKIIDSATAAINRSGKRRGATCIYLEVWHLDYEDFLELRKNTGDERRRTHELNTSSWIPDLFVKRVRAGEMWTMFSPNETPDLHSSYGKDFEQKYVAYEQKALAGELEMYKQVPAKDLWRKMVSMLFETGHPWMTFKDPCNLRSPQDHVGVVNSSNLCTEITLNTSAEETAVCNLGSVQLMNHINETGTDLDLDKIAKTIKTAIRMLDNVIDLNFYPTKEAEHSNLQHRPIGLGVMGFQDVLFALDMRFDSEEAVELSDRMMEMVSYHAILSSAELAKERGAYKTFKGSKWDRGMFPIDTLDYHEEQRGVEIPVPRTATLDWTKVRSAVKKYGMRNSNTMAIAPTATISNISGGLPSIEPIYKNIYVKSNISGEFTIVNEQMIRDLKAEGLWTADMLEKLKYFDGSISQIYEIPEQIRNKYKEAFELEPEWIIRHAARRGKWIDQSQSVNIFINTQSGKKISDTYDYAWEMGLKTTYYLRTLAASGIEKSTIDINKKFETKPEPVVEVMPVVVEPIAAAPAASPEIFVEIVTMDATTDPDAKLCVIGDPDCEACQ